jgi:hypothetical protein
VALGGASKRQGRVRQGKQEARPREAGQAGGKAVQGG